jgi:mono/diheme cytochrome c family protein
LRVAPIDTAEGARLQEGDAPLAHNMLSPFSQRKGFQMPRLLRRACLPIVVVALSSAALPSVAQVSTEHAPGRVYFSTQEKLPGATGGEIYENVCQGCHMPQGKGAVGAGAYPALAANKNVASASYVVYMVLNGRRAMPPFGSALEDGQVANIANYVRGQFGNTYSDLITAADVKAARAK